ncbi:hypothetical protein H0I76_08910 [Limibaculum sp. M0105]|uniref:Secreted protein n=1 Tax=Thermohalobaculum xanthum TaxID=2753746 RepID=A0A8J7M841_9RHOB|nr:hypothetical protein [Thermohalobaculum xanthum]MBK0399309.1 hypothetical protein [Thermohalobaculum xanthum]
MKYACSGSLALFFLLSPLLATAQVATGGATSDVVKEVAPTGETMAVPEAPPGSATESTVENEVDQQIKDAEKSVDEAEKDLQGGGTLMQGEIPEPTPTVPSTGG